MAVDRFAEDVRKAVEQRRVEYDLLGEYRIHQQIAMNFTWNGQKTPGRPGFYTGRFELRTYF